MKYFIFLGMLLVGLMLPPAAIASPPPDEFHGDYQLVEQPIASPSPVLVLTDNLQGDYQLVEQHILIPSTSTVHPEFQLPQGVLTLVAPPYDIRIRGGNSPKIKYLSLLFLSSKKWQLRNPH
jgi:hypothetical protein